MVHVRRVRLGQDALDLASEARTLERLHATALTSDAELRLRVSQMMQRLRLARLDGDLS